MSNILTLINELVSCSNMPSCFDINDEEIKLLQYHRLDTLLCSKLCSINSQFDTATLNKVKPNYEQNVINCDAFLNKARQVYNCLDEEGIQIIFLKGIPISYKYNDKYTRIYTDIDILIKHNDVERFTRIMKKNGYIQGGIKENKLFEASRREKVNSMLNTHELVPFLKREDGFLYVFDANILFQWKGLGNVQISNDELFSHIKCFDDNLKSLDDMFMLLHLCCHFYNETTRFVFSDYKFGKQVNELLLFRLVDILLILRSLKGREREIIEITVKLNLADQIKYTIKMINAFFPNNVDKELLNFSNLGKSIENDIDVYMTLDGKYRKWEISVFDRAFDMPLKSRIIQNMRFVGGK